MDHAERQLQYLSRTNGITRCPTSCVTPTKASLMPADRVPLEDYAVAHDGFAEKPLLANSKAPQ